MSAADNRLFDVVIVNWNAGEQLRDCVVSIYATAAELIARIIIVDNGSTDGSGAQAASVGDRTLLIDAGENLGFARGCNRGAAAGGAPWIVFLNPDTRLFEGTLRTLADYIKSVPRERAGIVGIRLIDERGETQRSCARFPSVRHYLGEGLGLTRLLPRVFPPHFMVEFDHLSSRPVDQAIGAFNAIPRPLFEKLGGFDEDFFVYLEDVDLARRAAAAGMPSYYLADATAFHKGGGTSDQVKAKRLFYGLRSRIVYAFKTFGPLGAGAVTAATLTTEFASRTLRALIRGEARETVSAYAMLWRDAPAIATTIRRVMREKRTGGQLHA